MRQFTIPMTAIGQEETFAGRVVDVQFIRSLYGELSLDIGSHQAHKRKFFTASGVYLR